MQHPSPALSSPSTGFFGPRASPLFTQSVDQPDPAPPPLSSSSDFSRPPVALVDDDNEQEQQPQAPPKQLAQAMEGLGQALRLIADVRLAGDTLMEALELATTAKQQDASKKASDLVVQARDSVATSLDALRAVGRKLEASGVLNGAQQRFEEKQPWGLQVPLICSDGSIVAYAWKRQIAGQAAASAVDRTRLALRAFTEQKKRYFPGFGSSNEGWGDESVVTDKKPRLAGSEANMVEPVTGSEGFQGMILADVLRAWQMDVPGMTITPFSRLEWVKQIGVQKSGLGSDHLGLGLFKPSSALKVGTDAPPLGNVSILEVIMPSVFRAVVTLFPSGSTSPDAISIFAVDEARGNVHPGALSSHAVFRQMTESAASALQNFLQFSQASALTLLLHWLYSYQSLFSKPCSHCKRILALDPSTDLLLPPGVRSASQVMKVFTSQLPFKAENMSDDKLMAYHVFCMPKET